MILNFFIPYCNNVIGLLSRLFGNKKQVAPPSNKNPRSEVIVLLNGYTESGVTSNENETPMQFCKNYTAMPELRDLALRLLGVPASSTASERVFSAGGYTCSSRRAKLSSEHLEKIMFINRNLKLLK